MHSERHSREVIGRYFLTYRDLPLVVQVVFPQLPHVQSSVTQDRYWVEYISQKRIYVQQTQPAFGQVASALCVPCALTVGRTFFLIPCAWCLPTHLSTLPCTQCASCSCRPSRQSPHPFPLLLLSSDGFRGTHQQFPALGPPPPSFRPPATENCPVASEIVWVLSARTPSSYF